jgi:5-methylcytosine-specific restriction endonuclease McrA
MRRPEMRAKRAGRNSPLWKGGISPEAKIIRMSAQYRDWRLMVFTRDDFRCLDCGERGGALNADHIFPFSEYPRLRFMLENGRTLCVECHKKTSTYGIKLVLHRNENISLS